MESQIELAPIGRSTFESGYNTEPQADGLSNRQFIQSTEDNRHEFSLPPTDRGKDAWLFLAGCFVIEGLVWGFPLSFGVFQEYYASHEPFASEPSGIAAIGTTASGIMYLSGLIVFMSLGRFPWLQRPSTLVGLPLLTIGILAASFANTVWQLILTQGVIYAIGGSILYCPTIIFLDEWFVARKGLAYGVMWGGTGAAGTLIPFFMSAGLERWGHRTMLRAWAVAIIVLTGPLLYYVKPRVPKSSATRPRPLDLRFLGSRVFWVLQGCNLIQSLGYFLPGLYLPTYAETINSPRIGGTISLALLNAASVFGNIGLGYIVDHNHVTNVLLMLAITVPVIVFIVWGLSTHLPVLIVFSVLYGLTAGAYATTWSGVIKETQKRYVSAEAGTLFGFLAAGRGIGAVVSGPLSESLLKTHTLAGESAYAYGTPYGSLILWTGTTASAGAIAWIVRRIGYI